MEISGKLIDQTPVISPEFGECVFAKIQLPAVRVEDIKAGDTIWSQKIVPDNEPLKHFLSRHDNIAAHFPKLESNNLRNKIADVIAKDIPWLDEDLLKLADKIVAMLPLPVSMPLIRK